MATIKDLGIVSAYGYAKSKGYTGTEEEFAILMDDYADVADIAEAWAVGTRAGVPVAEGDETYHNNSKYYAEQAAGSASDASDSAGAASRSAGAAKDSEDAAAASEAAAKDYSDHIADPVSGLVTGWLNDHVDPDTGYVIDNTLTVQNAAADAKKVGDELTDVKSAVNELDEEVFQVGASLPVYRTANGYRYDSIGQALATRDDAYHVQFIAVSADVLYITTAADSFCAFSTNDSTGNTFGTPYTGFEGYVVKPENANYFVISKKTTDSTTGVKSVASVIDELETGVSENAATTTETIKNAYAVTNAPGLEVGWIKTSGEEKQTGNYHRTGYVPVKNGETVKYRLSHGTAQPIIAFYNTSKVYDNSKSVIGIEGYSEGTYTATADGFVRFVYLDARSDVYAEFTDIIPDNVRLYIASEFTGKQKILLMGDSIFGNDGEIAGFLREKYTSCVNGAFGGTRVTDRGGYDPFQYFDGVNIINALCTQTWAEQDAAAENLEASYPWITGRLAGLKAVDMSEIDVLIMDWGTNDYTASATIEQICTAYETVIDALQTAFPALRIIITTPIWRYFSSSENGDNKVFNVSTLKEIALAIEQMAKDKRITVFNAYQNIPLSYATASTYYDSGDSTHLNTDGNKVYAGYLSGVIESVYGLI